MRPLPFYVSLTRTMTVCAIGIFLASTSFAQTSHPNDYIRSTRPLKSGGSITSLTSQGQTRSWLNQPATAQQPQARVASRDTGSDQGRSSASTSFYRQAQASNTAAGTYPYPGAALPSTVNATSRFESDQSAQLRYERAAVRDLNTGDLGNTESATSLPSSFGRQASVPTPAARVAQAAQTPAGSQSRSAGSDSGGSLSTLSGQRSSQYRLPSSSSSGLPISAKHWSSSIEWQHRWRHWLMAERRKRLGLIKRIAFIAGVSQHAAKCLFGAN